MVQTQLSFRLSYLDIPTLDHDNPIDEIWPTKANKTSPPEGKVAWLLLEERGCFGGFHNIFLSYD